MNERQLAITRNNSMRLLDPMQRRPKNCIRLNTNNTIDHEYGKFRVCWELLKEGKEFVTEAVFVNGKRADIFVLDTEEVIEILHTETKEQAKKKCKDYPVSKVIFISTDEIGL